MTITIYTTSVGLTQHISPQTSVVAHLLSLNYIITVIPTPSDQKYTEFPTQDSVLGFHISYKIIFVGHQ